MSLQEIIKQRITNQFIDTLHAYRKTHRLTQRQLAAQVNVKVWVVKTAETKPLSLKLGTLMTLFVRIGKPFRFEFEPIKREDKLKAAGLV